MERGETDQRDNYVEPHHHMVQRSGNEESRTELPEDLRHNHRWGSEGTLEHYINPSHHPVVGQHHHMVTKLYDGFEDGGTSSAPPGVPAATTRFDQLAGGDIGVLVENIQHGHNQNSTIDLSGCKGAVIAHWPNGNTSDGTYRIYYDMSQANQKTEEAREFLIINLRLRVDTFKQWMTQGASLTAAQPAMPTDITITEKTNNQEETTDISVGGLGEVTVPGHGKWDRGPKVWWDPTPTLGLVF